MECGSGDYRELDAEVAGAEHVEFIDLSRILADEYQKKGPDVVKTFFTIDHLHTNPTGADFNAAAVVSGLKTLKGDPFRKYLSPQGRAVAPDKGWRPGSVCGRIR